MKEIQGMKTSILHRLVVMSVVLLSRSFYRDSALAEGCPTPSFAAARTFDVGSEGTPVSFAVRDLNGDGNLDLVVANYGCSPCSPPIRGSVSVLVGNGDGTFQAVAKYDTGPNPQSVAVGDFTGDGKPDLAVANDGSTNIAVLLGNGDATFQAAVNYGMGGAPPYRAPSVLTTGDFNGDNKLDLAVANSGGVSVLFGNGDGTFQPAVSYATGANPDSVAVGDLNGDGKPDLAVVSGSGDGVSVLLNNGDGTFQAAANYGTAGWASSVVMGDFNGDGKTDLAVATTAVSPGSYNVSVLLGNGNGTFQTAVPYVVGSAPYSVTAGDFNGDGKSDLAVATDVGISLLSGKGDGTFQPPVNYSAGSHPNFVAAGDINGDGKPDLAVANPVGSVSVLLGN